MFINGAGSSKHSWGNLVVRWGYMEFLALGGYCGQWGSQSRMAFCGSALPKVIIDVLQPDTQFDVNVPEEPVPCVKSPSFLRDYTKTPAAYKWSLESERFAKVQTLRAAHPLSLSIHYANNRYTNYQTVASYVLSIIISKAFNRHQRNMVLYLCKYNLTQYNEKETNKSIRT